MLKWADETRRKLNSVDHESRATEQSSAVTVTPRTSSSEGSVSDEDSGLASPVFRSPKAASPVQRRRQKNLQAMQQRRRHSSCGQLYASPEQIVLAWNNKKAESRSQTHLSSTSLPNTPTDQPCKDFPVSNENNNVETTNSLNDSKTFRVSTKPELLQITSKQSDKNRPSFWKNLIGKKSWPSRTYKSPMRKSQSVVETYRKIEESYYVDSDLSGRAPHDRDQHESDYGLSNLVISSTASQTNSSANERGRSYHSLKTIRRQSDHRRPKLFMRPSGVRNHSPDGGFSDIRLSMSVSEEYDNERDSGVPRSPTLSSSSGSSDDSACYRQV